MTINKYAILISISISTSHAQSLTDALNSSNNNYKQSNSTVENVLTGNPRLACEAILCLSSATRPRECNPAINHYFSIQRKKLSDTLNARKNFLKLCPSSKEQNMPSLVNAIANGAGRCNASELNRIMRYTVQEKICENNRNKFGHGNDASNCYVITKIYIKPSKPAYCKQYFNHEWTTVGDSVQYVGEEKKGGHWVDK